ncbi:hypothetical protein IE81DRAFT_323532 [Ceraceosorus guamensis]|uniref:Uncharacterized protein n=1 Tax=Ceraceosorus guamensis TaxID=1522189 RepID=A0A316W1E1_9BASI|nr:hypothetical protein IE81DRAFT_323532 [Ceraceosorus guamensis]PWN42381.1 hypothetical protein IE81DRAFT_323532 [Ceraceosorus guamensis]
MPFAYLLTPASLAQSALFAGYYAYLNINVCSYRRLSGVAIGDGLTIGVSMPAAAKTDKEKQVAARGLARAFKAQGDFWSQTPFALIFLSISELNGLPYKWVHIIGSTLFLSRVLASQLALLDTDRKEAVAQDEVKRYRAAEGGARAVTGVIMLGVGFYNLRLGWKPLKDFLSF